MRGTTSRHARNFSGPALPPGRFRALYQTVPTFLVLGTMATRACDAGLLPPRLANARSTHSKDLHTFLTRAQWLLSIIFVSRVDSLVEF